MTKHPFDFAEAAGGEGPAAPQDPVRKDGHDVPEAEAEPPVDAASPAYHEIIAKSLVHKGNTKRLKAAIEKARRGEEVTIAYIGGSITHGAGAIPLNRNCYAYQSYERFKRKFAPAGSDTIRLIKAGVGGTPSELGIVRYERDVLRDGDATPDIVVVEFAVNDAGDETNGNCYESLVIKALDAPNKPAVILLFSVFLNDWNLQERLAPVGWHYDLPMVSVKDAVVEQFRWTRAEGNVISKRQFFHDIYHPTNTGHAIMADCLTWLFDVVDRSAPDEQDVRTDKSPVIGNDFVGVRLLDRRNAQTLVSIVEGAFCETDVDLQLAEMDDQTFGTPQFPYNWMRAETTGDDPFRMTIRARALILVFKDTGESDFGSADVRVDGRHVKIADPHEVNWTHCHAVLLYNEPFSGEHAVEIGMAAGHEDKRFTILGFGYVP